MENGQHLLDSLELQVYTTAPQQPLLPCAYSFGDVQRAAAHGLVGRGADFRPETIVEAYRRGVFPWPQRGQEYLWFSPDPRAIIPIDGLRVSSRLARTLRQGRFRLSVDAAFERVISECGRGREEGTWITTRLRRAYLELHALGYAHSFEAWTAEGELAGGLYGIGVGGMYGAESMFHRVTDASKVAMAAMMAQCQRIGVQLVDIQVLSPHTESMGAIEISREEYLSRLGSVLRRDVRWVGPA